MQEFDVLSWLWIQRLFLKIFIALSFGQVCSHNLEFSKQTLVWHRDICDYDFDIYFFKIFAIQFSGKFDLKISLKLSPKIAPLFACQVFCFPKWSEFVFWNSSTQITNTRMQSIYSSQTKLRSWRSNFQRNSVKCHD